MERCLIVAGGTMDISFAKKFLEERRYGCVIAADAGLKTLSQLHLKPDAVVGDMDTVDGALLADCEADPSVSFVVHRAEKDETDTALALMTAARRGFQAVDLLGALGGRMDHAIGNIQLMYRYFRQGMEICIYDARNKLYLIGGSHTFYRKTLYGKYVSFLPVTEAVTGLTLRGFKYPLNRCTVYLGDGLCISNELSREEARMELETGVMLCVESRD